MNADLYDVVLIGYGPVGQTMASLLGQQGHSVAVFERWPNLYGRARAGHVDHEIMRVFQSIHVAEAFEKVTYVASAYDWINAEGKVLIHFSGINEAPSGWPPDLLMYQPDLEDLLDKEARAQPSVEINLGWEATALTQHDDYVELTVRQGEKAPQGQWLATGETRTVRARYLIGADGANSFVRQALNFVWEDMGFSENWLVVDFRPNDAQAVATMPEMAQLCDPARPTTLGHQGDKYARWEFKLLPGEQPAKMATPEKVWELISPWVTPDQGHLLRHVVYNFRSILAEQWRKGNVLLVGDAAHLMPPFLGQGLCSGIRDAKNLAWKLDHVLRDKADATLLDSYATERRPHVRSIIEQAVMLGSILCMTDPFAAAARDQALLSGVVPPPPAFPGLTDGILYRDNQGTPIAPAGQLSVQGQVSYQGKTGRFDDIVGQGWTVISSQADPRSVLSAEQIAFLNKLDAHIVQVGAQNVDNQDVVIDLAGVYANYFAKTGLQAVLVRPDFYVFGGAATLADLPTLVEALRTQVHSSQQSMIA